VLDAIRSFAVARAGLEGLQGPSCRGLDLLLVDTSVSMGAGERGRVLSRAFPEDQEIGEGVAAEPVGPVDPRRSFTRGEQPGDGRHLRIAVHADAAHGVVRGGPHLHWFARDVHVRELLELMIHARELSLDVLLRVRQPLLDPRDVQIDASVGAAATFLDLADDAARNVVTGEQLRRPARVPVPLRV
jgi:hypothetical protein